MAGEPRAHDERLARECGVFARYLVGRPPSAYVVAKYLEGHAHLPRAAWTAADHALVAAAAAHPLVARLADASARLLRPRALLRHKLVLAMAILESCAPSHHAYDPPAASGPARPVVRLALAGAGFALTLLVALLVFVPVFGLVALATRARSRAAPRVALRGDHR